MVAIAAAENEEVGRSSAHCQVYLKILPHTTKVVLLKKKTKTRYGIGTRLVGHCLPALQITGSFKYHAPKSIKHFQVPSSKIMHFLNILAVIVIHYLDHTILANRISGHKNVFS